MAGNPDKEVCELVLSQESALEPEFPDWVSCLEDEFQGPEVLPRSRVNFLEFTVRKAEFRGEVGQFWGVKLIWKKWGKFIWKAPFNCS